MRRRPAADRLAIWTYVQEGEEFAHGDPSVTDEERAAAGRETLAGRWRELTEANRRRAAEQYESGGLPPDQDVLRVWYRRDPSALRARLGDAPVAVWAEDDILHVVWQGQADRVQLAGGVQPNLWPVGGADELWEASLRIRRLDEAVISIVVLPSRAGEDPFGRPAVDQLTWRGSRASAPPRAEALTGTIEEHMLDSAALGRPRGVTVPSGWTAPDCPTATRSGSAATIRSGGTSSYPSRSPGC